MSNQKHEIRRTRDGVKHRQRINRSKSRPLVISWKRGVATPIADLGGMLAIARHRYIPVQ